MYRLVIALALALIALPAGAQSSGAQTSNAGLSGQWQGSYGYTDSRPAVSFIMEATFTDGGLSGSISEPNTFGTPGVAFLHAYVQGSIDGDVIQFTKTYDGTGGQNHSVQYNGVIDRSNHRITGTWRIQGSGGQFTMTMQ
jgi:hypothetical protein